MNRLLLAAALLLVAIPATAEVHGAWTALDHGDGGGQFAELAAAGYRNLSVRDLTRLAANGINAEFISRFGSHQ